jgi:general stress protein 26
MGGQKQQGLITKDIVDQFISIVGEANVLMDETSLNRVWTRRNRAPRILA